MLENGRLFLENQLLFQEDCQEFFMLFL